MDVVMNVCDPVVVMAYGKVLAKGTPADDPGQRRSARSLSRGRLMALLEIDDVVAGYGIGPDILTGLSLKIEADKSYCIIGPNGAGKSTLLKAICGLLTTAARARRPSRAAAHRAAHRRDPASRHLLRAAGPQPLPGHDGPREPADGRLHPQGPRTRSSRRIEGVLGMFPILQRAAAASSPRRCPAASSRCSLLGRALVLRPDDHHARRAVARARADRLAADLRHA